MSFWHKIIGTILAPAQTFEKMAIDENIFIHSIIYFFALGIIYLFVVLVFIKVGFSPWYPPLLKIPREKYYFYELFFQPPVTFFCFVMVTGVIRFISELFGINDAVSFNTLFAIIIYALFIPILIWFVHDSFYAILFLFKLYKPEQFYKSFKAKGTVFIFNTLVIIITSVWHIVLLILVVYNVERLSLANSILTGFLSLLPFYLIWVAVFQR